MQYKLQRSVILRLISDKNPVPKTGATIETINTHNVYKRWHSHKPVCFSIAFALQAPYFDGRLIKSSQLFKPITNILVIMNFLQVSQSFQCFQLYSIISVIKLLTFLQRSFLKIRIEN